MMRIEVNVVTGEVREVAMTPEEIAAIPPAPPPVLQPITARQLRLTLLGLGITGAMVETALNGIADEAARDVALIEWEYATTFPREHPMIAHIGTALGMTEAQIDDAWRQAAAL